MLKPMLERAKQGKGSENLINRPVLWPHLEWVLDAFWDICADRGGDGTGPILFASIDAAGRRLGITDPEEFRWFSRMIRGLDSAWLTDLKRVREYKQAEAESRQKINAGPKVQRTRR